MGCQERKDSWVATENENRQVVSKVQDASGFDNGGVTAEKCLLFSKRKFRVSQGFLSN